MRKKTISLLLCSTLFSVSLFAVDQKELASYTAQKHKASFEKQEQKIKDEITKEYEKMNKLAQILEKDKMKNDVDYKVTKTMAMVGIWSNKFMKDYNPTDSELQALYLLLKPKAVSKYNLRNILVSHEKNADSIIKSLNEIKEPKAQLTSFIKNVKENSKDTKSKEKDGLSGLIDSNKLNPDIIAALKDKKEGDIVKVNIKGVGTQIILIDKYVPQKDATFEESKNVLIQSAKRNALNKEIELLLK